MAGRRAVPAPRFMNRRLYPGDLPGTGTPSAFVEDRITEFAACLQRISLDAVVQVFDYIIRAFRTNRQVFIAGNGGSAATALHLATDLRAAWLASSGARQRPAVAVRALGDNLATVTAIANDSGYDNIFSEQLRHLMVPGDTLLVLSVSGRSANIVKAVHAAHAAGGDAVALLGAGGGEVAALVRASVCVDSADCGQVEATHQLLGHLIAGYLRADRHPPN